MVARLVLLTLCACSARTAFGAEGRLYLDDVTAPNGTTGLEIPLLADSDVDLLGFSFGIRYDPAALALVSVTKEGTDAAGAEFFEGKIKEAEGLIGYGCVVSVNTDPRASKIPSGSGRLLANLVVDIIGAPGSTTQLILETVPTNDDPDTPVKCVLTDDLGRSIAPTLVSGSVTVEAGDVPFVRGDANGDEDVDIADGVRVLVYLFVGGVTPTCLDALDADDTGVVDVSDAVYVLDYLFKSGSPIPLPFPEAGIDPTDDDLAPCE